MKNTKKITLSSLMIALASLFMLTSYFPYLTVSIPAFAGLFIMVLVIEIDKKWAVLSYIASAVIVFFLAEPEAKLLYIAFFGYYPIVKSLLEGLKSIVLEYVLKFAIFNTAVILTYTVFAGIVGVSVGDMNEFGKYTAPVLLIVANFVFIVYDIALTRVIEFYNYKIHDKVVRSFKF